MTRVRALLAIAALAVVTACTGASDRSGAETEPPAPSAGPTPSPSAPAAVAAGESRCPVGSGSGPAISRIARGSSDRPIVRLCFDVREDKRIVTGTETVAYVASRRTCEAVFRAWPNKPASARGGTSLEIGNVRVDGRQVHPEIRDAGAGRGAPGTLIRVPIPGCAQKDDEVRFDLDFRLTLGEDSNERAGYRSQDSTAWFGTAYPLLAWKNGDGWDTQPAVPLFGETATSEVFDLAELTVIAPEGEEVLGTGEALPTEPGPEPGTVVHRFRATGDNAVRDVAVSVGQFDVADTRAHGVHVRAAVPSSGSEVPAEVWLRRNVQAIGQMREHFGPFPYDNLWVTVTPGVPTGVEFPSAIQFSDINPSSAPDLIPHEVAHQWFYGLVGNDQGQHPWLDEAFATYAETMVNNTEQELLSYRPPDTVRHEVGRSMQWYAELDQPSMYGEGVYTQGGKMLLEARREAGPDHWDRLIRRYLKRHGQEIATPAELAEVLRPAPEALEVLREYGAIR